MCFTEVLVPLSHFLYPLRCKRTVVTIIVDQCNSEHILLSLHSNIGNTSLFQIKMHQLYDSQCSDNTNLLNHHRCVMQTYFLRNISTPNLNKPFLLLDGCEIKLQDFLSGK